MTTSDMTRGTVVIPEPVADSLRERIRVKYPEIADAPLSMLMRFAVVCMAGMPIESALRVARSLPRGPTAKPSNQPDWTIPESGSFT